MKRETILLRRATYRWEKRQADPSCKSENPDDCMVMCLVDVPAINETFYIVTDTSINKQYKITKIPFKVVEEIGGRTAWVEVVCAKDMTYEKIKAVQQALNDRGYNVEIIDGIMSTDTKNQLDKFQTENHLPVGNLNMETLAVLGIL